MCAKFSNSNVRSRRIYPTAPTRVTDVETLTHEGGRGFVLDDKTALYTLAVTNMVGEATFYESGPKRDERFVDLIRKVTAEDPAWIQGFIPFLRDECNMRSASIVVAAEYAKALGDYRVAGATNLPSARTAISAACSRPDEPAELLGYWLATYGRKLPAAVKRGIADAAINRYSEYAALKYDGGSRGVRMGDVIELTHPDPATPEQSDLFRYLLDRRHGHDNGVPESLVKISRAVELEKIPVDQRRSVLAERGSQALAEAGFTWERLSGWIPGGMDAKAWEAIIPSMGYMALLRNLRNFEQAGVAKSMLLDVAETLADPEQVARSRQFPYRFYSAWKNSGSTFFASALEEALDLSVKNIPEFSGRTLVAIDTSGSMQSTVSGRSNIMMYEIGALFGSAVANRNDAHVILFGDRWESRTPKTSVLRNVDDIRSRIGRVGYGTVIWPSVAEAFAQFGPFDRVVVLTDMQEHPTRATNRVPDDVPVYVWDLRGYGLANIPNQPGRYLFSGFSDSAFKMINLLERGISSAWPWEG